MAKLRPSAEQEWQDADTGARLLTVLFPRHRTTDAPGLRRRLRLVACGGLRAVWDAVPDELRPAVEVAERFADDRIGRKSLDTARQTAQRRRAEYDDRVGRLWNHSGPPDALARWVRATRVAECVKAACERSVTVAWTAEHTLPALAQVAAPLARWVEMLTDPGGGEDVRFDADPTAAVVQCVFGGPTPVRFPKAWKTATVTAIAAGIAADAALDRLPVLADALEDAGCESLPVLAHCRGPGPHRRGCWVVDGLLGQ